MRPALSYGLPAVDPTAAPALILPAVAGSDDLARLCGDVRARLVAGGSGVVVCDARALGGRGLAAVDLLARLELTARRAGGRIRIRRPPPNCPPCCS